MSVFYYEPYYNWDRFFDEALSRNVFGGQGQGQQQRIPQGEHENQIQRFLKPRMDLHENAENNTVTATFEFPGVKKEEVNIEVVNGRLTVSAETKISEEHENEGYAVRERRFGRYSRTLQLPQGIKEEDIKASMEHGILTVTFPKTGREQESKRITIN